MFCICQTAQPKWNKKISCRESWYSALQCHIRHLKLFQTWILWHLLLCSCSFLLKILSRIIGHWWTVVVSVGILMDFFICLGFVNLFKFCILMIFVLCKFSQNISIIFFFLFSFNYCITLWVSEHIQRMIFLTILFNCLHIYLRFDANLNFTLFRISHIVPVLFVGCGIFSRLKHKQSFECLSYYLILKFI